MKLTIPVTTMTEFELSDDMTDNILLDILYHDYHETWKHSASPAFLDAIKLVFLMYSEEDLDDMQERVH